MNSIFNYKNLRSFALIAVSSVIMAIATNTMIQNSMILSGGFMGVSLLTNMVSSNLGFEIPTYVILLTLNIPVAMFCYREISPRFTLLSLTQVVITSMLLRVIPVVELVDDILLKVVFGGFFFGIAITLALWAGASSGGTDFIALYVSNKSGREIWNYVFGFNIVIMIIFGVLYGADGAAYTVLFQFISTQTIGKFHTRYKRVRMEIITNCPDEIKTAFFKTTRHGITVFDCIGGYSGKPFVTLVSVVSSYQVPEIIDSLVEVDPHVIVNTTKVLDFQGRFYNAPIE